MAEPITNDDATVVYFQDQKVLLSTQPAKAPFTPVERRMISLPYEPWGDDNMYGKNVYDRTRLSDIIHPTLAWQSNQIASARLQYGVIRGFDERRNEIFEPLNIPEIEDWLSENDQDLYLEEVIRDLKWWSHAFTELRLNPEGTYISTLNVFDALHCRFGRQNETTGNKDFVYVDANWNTGMATQESWKKIPNLDPYYNVQGQIRESKNKVWIYGMSFSSPGKIYYQDTPWHTIINSNWLDVAEKIPAFKKYLMDNQMAPAYIIHVPEDWWSWKFKNWTSMTQLERETSRRSVIEEFNNVFTGVTSAGKILMLTFKVNSQNTKQFTKWEVVPMGAAMGDGTYLEDSQEASSHQFAALNQHPSLSGQTPGKTMGGGSGSDMRVAMNVFMINSLPFIKKAAKPYEIITRFNQWQGPKKERIVWRPCNYMIETTDTGHQVSNSGTNPNKDN